jgi:methylated-DNA-[protein]-cysteine S-methyltransferase
MTSLAIPTAEGVFIAHYSRQGLARLSFPETNSEAVLPKNEATALPAEIRRWHDLTTTALNETLAGRAPRLLPPLDLSSGTEFQRRVWGALCRITSGRTLSYAEVAVKVGHPRATRAVGGACGANPIPVLVPCHRVLAARQALGGFSSGLAWKRRLLAREGIAFR